LGVLVMCTGLMIPGHVSQNCQTVAMEHLALVRPTSFAAMHEIAGPSTHCLQSACFSRAFLPPGPQPALQHSLKSGKQEATFGSTDNTAATVAIRKTANDVMLRMDVRSLGSLNVFCYGLYY
jgi:hypothetical protein